MKIYDESWAKCKVWEWRRSNPRVGLMIEAFTVWAGATGMVNPKEFVIARCVMALRCASFKKDWERIKQVVDYQISWPVVFEHVVMAGRVSRTTQLNLWS
jgi:hypothetical protein